MNNFIAILRRYSVAMVMNFVGLVLALTIAVAGYQYWSSANADPAEVLKKE